jgi:hypothetical protein
MAAEQAREMNQPGFPSPDLPGTTAMMQQRVFPMRKP